MNKWISKSKVKRLCSKQYDCFWTVFNFFIKAYQVIQKYYCRKQCSCNNSNKESIILENLIINQLTNKILTRCNECNSDSYESVEFLYELNWLICENLNQPDLVSIDSLPKEICLKTKSNYSLLCSVISLKEGHD